MSIFNKNDNDDLPLAEMTQGEFRKALNQNKFSAGSLVFSLALFYALYYKPTPDAECIIDPKGDIPEQIDTCQAHYMKIFHAAGALRPSIIDALADHLSEEGDFFDGVAEVGPEDVNWIYTLESS